MTGVDNVKKDVMNINSISDAYTMKKGSRHVKETVRFFKGSVTLIQFYLNCVFSCFSYIGEDDES